MSWLLRSKCDYCNQECSRRQEDYGKLPMLHTPEIYGMESVVCDVCLINIRISIKKMYKEMAKGETK